MTDIAAPHAEEQAPLEGVIKGEVAFRKASTRDSEAYGVKAVLFTARR